MSAKKVLSLGQCAADHGSIGRMLRGNFGAEVVAADTFAEALALLREGGFDLILVNGALAQDGPSGLDFPARLKDEESLRLVPAMLVSNYENAQAQAVERGALPGFGKSALGHPRTLGRLGAVLGEFGAPTES